MDDRPVWDRVTRLHYLRLAKVLAKCGACGQVFDIALDKDTSKCPACEREYRMSVELTFQEVAR